MGTASSSRRVTAQDRAILNMKLQRDKLRQYQKKIQTILDREHAIAKECLSRSDKPRALLALRRRKYQEQLLAKTDAELETLERLTSTIEFSLVEKDVLYGLAQGNAVLKEIHKEMSLESVEKLMEETAEAVAYQKEVSEMLAGRISNQDEEEVEDELERLEAEVTGKRLEEDLATHKDILRRQEDKLRRQEQGARSDEERTQQQEEPEAMMAV